MNTTENTLSIHCLLHIIRNLYEKSGHPVAFRDLLDEIRLHPQLCTNEPSVSGDAFADAIDSTLLPVSDLYTAFARTDDPDSSLIPAGRSIYTFRHLNHLVNTMEEHRCTEIIFQYRGCADFEFEEEKRTLHEGNVCILSPGSRSLLHLHEGAMALSVLIRSSFLQKMASVSPDRFHLIPAFLNHIIHSEKPVSNYLLIEAAADTSILSPLISLILESNHEKDFCSDALCESWLRIFLLSLQRSSQSIRIRSPLARTRDMFPILTYLERNYASVSLSSLAHEFHYSTPYLSQLIHQSFGISFSEIMTNIRMTHAVDELLNSDLSVQKIAEKLGYSGPDHFIRTFSSLFGLTPAAYRKNHTRKKTLPHDSV